MIVLGLIIGYLVWMYGGTGYHGVGSKLTSNLVIYSWYLGSIIYLLCTYCLEYRVPSKSQPASLSCFAGTCTAHRDFPNSPQQR